MIVFYNPVWSKSVHFYKKHPYIYYLPNTPVLVYDSQLSPSVQQAAADATFPSDYKDILSVFVTNNLGNLSTLRYPPYSGRRFQPYYG